MKHGDSLSTKTNHRQSKRRPPRGPIYSVVDLETTGTSARRGDRIIQIGAVLVQDGKIINQFETKINPRTTIPRSIEQLTGIRNADVRNAPLFEDVAGTIYSLLSGTTFVAHNVNFDFPFLNGELERAGYPSLPIKAIDTVTMSQILLPTAKSYRLRDLTASLAIEHDHPHSAVSDAEATAHLLVDLLKKLHRLPTLTLEKLVQLQLKLPQQTGDLFKQELADRVDHPLPLRDDLYVSHGMVLHKVRPASTTVDTPVRPYPATKRAKVKLFGDQLSFRPTQSKMMNAIHKNYTSDEPQPMIVEAGTGTGKTLGYLLPLAYAAYPDKKIVVSTATNLLQQQIALQAMHQLDQVLPFPLNSVVVKGNQHYLDLARFVHSLAVIDDAELVQLLKAQILVWLLSTTSGDLDELNLNLHHLSYLAEIRHQGLKTISERNEFYQDDFLVRRAKQLHSANVIITNHAYLVDHAEELGDGTRRPYLVVDEAQHLSESILRRSRQTLNFQQLRTAIHVLEGLVARNADRNLVDIFDDDALGSYNVELLRDDLAAVTRSLDALQQALYRQFMMNVHTNTNNELIEQPLDNQNLLHLLQPDGPIVMQLEQALASVRLHFSALHHLFVQQADRWLFSDRYLMSQFQSQWQLLVSADHTLRDFTLTLNQRGDEAAFWLTIKQSSERSSMQLAGGLLAVNHYLTENVYPYFAQPLFVGATLFTSSRSNYLYDQLDLDRAQTIQKRFASPFDYQHRSQLLVAQDAPVPGQSDNGEYIHYLARTIYDLTKHNRCQTMILFNSLVTIEQVYSQLRETDLFDQRDILAQGITGRKEKLLKQFASGSSAILLGAASFWEGIDLPKTALELLIVTRLPFDAPNEIMTRAYNGMLRSHGKNPFYHSSLPKATMRLQQGIGRLLRTPDDFGCAVILDSRIASRRYGHSMLRNLPKGMPVQTLPTKQVVADAHHFIARWNNPGQAPTGK